MFPGYVTIYKDIDEFIHLYFYPGIDNEGEFYYRDLDLTGCNVEYREIINDDNSKEYIFINKKIIRVICKLIDKFGKLHLKELTI